MTGYRSIKAQALRHGQAVQTRRSLPEEVPVALVYNGTTQAVMMATPCDLEDFGRGFTRTEGLGEVERIEVITHATGIEVQMWLPETQADALATRRRAMTGPVGCGLCGIDSLDQAVRSLPAVAGGITLSPRDVGRAMAALRDGQILHNKTRAMHAAGFYVPSQGLICLREDVGRHNALDKLVGAVPDCTIGAVVLTSRVSVDMVQKTALSGASLSPRPQRSRCRRRNRPVSRSPPSCVVVCSRFSPIHTGYCARMSPMSHDKIVRMTNQIAIFFESQPQPDKAACIAAHLREFWEPRMLNTLAAVVSEGGSGLSPLALEGALRVLAQPA